MATRKSTRPKTGGRDFIKGKPGGPGRPKVDPDLVEARKLTKTEFLNIMTEYLSMQTGTLKQLVKDESKPVLHMIVGQIALRAIYEGDEKALTFFMDRLVGPAPKEPQDINLNLNVQSLPPERVITLARDAIKFIEEHKE